MSMGTRWRNYVKLSLNRIFETSCSKEPILGNESDLLSVLGCFWWMLLCLCWAGRLNVKAGVGSPPAMTSGSGNNAPTVTGSAPQNGENKPPPQAVVKPQILTHVIEGFVIKEGAEPFPVSAFYFNPTPWLFKMLFSVSGSCIIIYHILHLVNCCFNYIYSRVVFIVVR